MLRKKINVQYLQAKLSTERLICLAANQYVVDHIMIGIIILDACANVISLNPEAHAIMNHRDGLSMTHRRLTPSDAAPMQFSTALQTCLSGASTEVALCIARPSGKRPYECVISQICDLAGSSGLRGHVVVFITDSERAWISSDLLANRHGLTPTEAALTPIFAQGQSIQHASKTMSIAQSTVRSHLKHLMHKLGVQRQAELVAALLQYPPVRRQAKSTLTDENRPRMARPKEWRSFTSATRSTIKECANASRSKRNHQKRSSQREDSNEQSRGLKTSNPEGTVVYWGPTPSIKHAERQSPSDFGLHRSRARWL